LADAVQSTRPGRHGAGPRAVGPGRRAPGRGRRSGGPSRLHRADLVAAGPKGGPPPSSSCSTHRGPSQSGRDPADRRRGRLRTAWCGRSVTPPGSTGRGQASPGRRAREGGDGREHRPRIGELKDAACGPSDSRRGRGDLRPDWTSPSRRRWCSAPRAGAAAAGPESCDGWPRFPCGGHVDSLNVSVAAAVVLFEAVRQRRRREPKRRSGGLQPAPNPRYNVSLRPCGAGPESDVCCVRGGPARSPGAVVWLARTCYTCRFVWLA